VKLTQPDIVRAAQQMPASPRILARLSEVLADINSDTADVVELVKADPGITSGLIRLSNSALFAFAEPSTTLEEAIGRVGFREVYRLVGLASTSALFPKQLGITTRRSFAAVTA
jgi:HD-like signal output (HDOD) protein